jgi:hypothetical protein
MVNSVAEWHQHQSRFTQVYEVLSMLFKNTENVYKKKFELYLNARLPTPLLYYSLLILQQIVW